MGYGSRIRTKKLFMTMTARIKYRRILTFVLLPFVVLGLIYIFQHKRASDVGAIDLISVTYDGHTTTDPIFTLDDMKPGDEYQKCFTVKNVNTTDSFDILMKSVFISEEKEFADILEIVITLQGGSDIYGGTAGYKNVQNFLDEATPLNLGNYSPGAENTYCITVKFPSKAGNEYQLAKLIFDLVWWAEIVDNDIPWECRRMTFERVIEGTEGDDYIHASTRAELILAKGGNDYVRGSSGSDCIVGGDGDDYLEEESGAGVILGGNGNDEIDAGSGNDLVYGGAGNDKIKTGSGPDVVYGGDGDDIIDTGTGFDKAYGENGNDYLEAGDNDDEMYGGDGNDTIIGESGNDRLYGESGNDVIYGNSGDDYLDGGSDTDELDGNGDTDTCLNGEVLTSCEL